MPVYVAVMEFIAPSMADANDRVAELQEELPADVQIHSARFLRPEEPA